MSQVPDASILRAVASLRATQGRATVRDIADAVGMSVAGTQARIERLVGAGTLARDPGKPGSLRLGTVASDVIRVQVLFTLDAATGQPIDVTLVSGAGN